VQNNESKNLEWRIPECILDLQSLHEIWKQKECNRRNRNPSKEECYSGKHRVSEYKGASWYTKRHLMLSFFISAPDESYYQVAFFELMSHRFFLNTFGWIGSGG